MSDNQSATVSIIRRMNGVSNIELGWFSFGANPIGSNGITGIDVTVDGDLAVCTGLDTVSILDGVSNTLDQTITLGNSNKYGVTFDVKSNLSVTDELSTYDLEVFTVLS